MTTPPPGLTSTQRTVLIALGVTVLLTAVLLVVVLASRSAPTDDVAHDQPTSTPPPEAAPTTGTTEAAQTTVTTVTTEPESTTTAPATTTEPPVEHFILRADGIDRVFFGADDDTTIDHFADRLGEADSDTGWVDNLDTYDGLCLGTEVRFVAWDNFELFFTDGPSSWAGAGVQHFASYRVTGDTADAAFETSTGVKIGDTVDAIQAAYGDAVRILEHPIYDAIFEFDPPGGGLMVGLLSGLDPDDTVFDISGGFSCGE